MNERPYKRHRIALPVDAVEKLTELEASDDSIPNLSNILSAALDDWLVNYQIKQLLKD